MENKKEKLFLLIKAMSGNEKGYFKKYASLHTIGKENNYVLLFDVIAGQRSYDEQKVKTLVRKHILPRNFREAKNYLYEMILKSLDHYHSGASATFALRRLLTSVEILFTKTLYDQCKDLLNKAETLAVKYEKFNVLAEIYEWKLKIVVTAESFKGIEERDLRELKEKENAVQDKMQKMTEYRFLNASLFFNLKKNRFVRKQEELVKTYGHIWKHLLVQDENQANSVFAKLSLYSTLGAYHFIAQDKERSKTYYTKYLRLFEDHPQHIQDKFHNYLTGIYNLTVAHMQLHEYDEAMRIIDKLYPIKAKTPQEAISKFIFYYSRKLEIYLNKAEPVKAIKLVPFIEEGIKKYHNKLNIAHIFAFYYNIACVYHLCGYHRKAIPWLNKIINHTAVNVSNDIQSFARILNLIIHYELSNADHLPYVIRSAYHFLIRKERLFEFEKTLIGYIKKLANTHDEADLKKLLIDFKKELVVLDKDSYEKRAIEYFDFIRWIDSKIENKPFLEVMKRNYLKGRRRKPR